WELGTLKHVLSLLQSMSPTPRHEVWRLGVAAANRVWWGFSCVAGGFFLGTPRRDWVYVGNGWVTPRRGSARLGIGGLGLGYAEATLKRGLWRGLGFALGRVWFVSA
ncbi:hypothetical protein PIB30_101972, partial [Stylosanthes scabra]|nr:hypothetical protein [Stylosanthes scabra]